MVTEIRITDPFVVGLVNERIAKGDESPASRIAGRMIIQFDTLEKTRPEIARRVQDQPADAEAAAAGR